MECPVLEINGKHFYVLRWQALPPIDKRSRKYRYWRDIEEMLGVIAKLYTIPVLGLTRLYCVYKPDPRLGLGVLYLRLGRWYAWYFPWRHVDSFFFEYGARDCRYVYISVMHSPLNYHHPVERRLRECYEEYVSEYRRIAFPGLGEEALKRGDSDY